MTAPRLRPVPLVLGLLAAAASAQDVASLPGSLASCRRLADASQRLACYDRLADGPATSPVKSKSTAAAPPPATGEALFGKPPEIAADTATRAAGATPVDNVTAVATAATHGDDRRLAVTLANGQAWRQVDTDWIEVRPGDTVTIRKAALGSYLLTGARSRTGVHVRRVR